MESVLVQVVREFARKLVTVSAKIGGLHDIPPFKSAALYNIEANTLLKKSTPNKKKTYFLNQIIFIVKFIKNTSNHCFSVNIILILTNYT